MTIRDNVLHSILFMFFRKTRHRYGAQVSNAGIIYRPIVRDREGQAP